MVIHGHKVGLRQCVLTLARYRYSRLNMQLFLLMVGLFNLGSNFNSNRVPWPDLNIRLKSVADVFQLPCRPTRLYIAQAEVVYAVVV